MKDLVNYFKAVPEPEKIEKLEDLAPAIELYHHMVRAGKFDDACRLYMRRIDNLSYYQFSAYQMIIELLTVLFKYGDKSLPHLKEKSDQASILNSLANAYSMSGQPLRAIPLYDALNAITEKANHKKNLAIGLTNISATAQIYIGALKNR